MKPASRLPLGIVRLVASLVLLAPLVACDDTDATDFVGRWSLVQLGLLPMPILIDSAPAMFFPAEPPCEAQTVEIWLDGITLEMQNDGDLRVIGVARYQYDCLPDESGAPTETFVAEGSWTARGDEADLEIPETVSTGPDSWIVLEGEYTASLPDDDRLPLRVDDEGQSVVLVFERA